MRGGGGKGTSPKANGAGYTIGYGNPPSEHRFAKGTSGNPKGRPRKSGPTDEHTLSGLTSSQKLWLEEANAPVRVKQDGKVRTMPAQQAVIINLRSKALAGGITANRIYLAAIAEAQRTDDTRRLTNFTDMVEMKVFTEREIDYRRKAGKPIDDVLPHPDDIIVDPRAGWAKLIGPVTEQERDEYAPLIAARDVWQKDVSDTAKVHADAPPRRQRAALADWHEAQARFDRINDWLPPSLQTKLADRSVAPGASCAGQFFTFAPEALRALQSEGPRRRTRSK